MIDTVASDLCRQLRDLPFHHRPSLLWRLIKWMQSRTTRRDDNRMTRGHRFPQRDPDLLAIWHDDRSSYRETKIAKRCANEWAGFVGIDTGCRPSRDRDHQRRVGHTR